MSGENYQSPTGQAVSEENDRGAAAAHANPDTNTSNRLINSGKATKMRRDLISYLFQSYALIQSQTALSNMLLGMRYADGTRKQKIARVHAILDRLGLPHIVNDKVFTLSGGEQQRVALARCILKPGMLILADEPTGALDPKLANIVLNEILQLQHEYGKSLIIVTHDRHIAQACDMELQLRALN
ncbi:MAG: ATP-binding cassette domain-containing protein [Varibaculum sp.]|nr:ATP-binding cassette domain-containing protein [Varibaculum sp.]